MVLLYAVIFGSWNNWFLLLHHHIAMIYWIHY